MDAVAVACSSNEGEDRMMMCNVVMNELLKNTKTSNDRLTLMCDP